MYVCIYVYIYIYTDMYSYACIYTYVHMYIHRCVYTCICIDTYAYIISIYLQQYIHTHISTDLLASLRFSPQDGWLKVLYHSRVKKYDLAVDLPVQVICIYVCKTVCMCSCLSVCGYLSQPRQEIRFLPVQVIRVYIYTYQSVYVYVRQILLSQSEYRNFIHE